MSNDLTVPQLSAIRVILLAVAAFVALLVVLPIAALAMPLFGITVDSEIREDTTPDAHLVRDVSTVLTFIKPSRYPLDTLLRRMDVKNGVERAKAVKVEWEEDEAIPRSDTVNGLFNPGAAFGDMTVDNGERFRVDDVLYLPDNATTPGFILHVTAKNGNVLTVRGVNPAASETAYSTIPSVADGEVVKKLTRSREEKSDSVQPIATFPDQYYNFCEISDTALSYSATRAVTRNYTLKDVDRNEARILFDYRRDLESKQFFGQRAEIPDATNSRTRWFMGGIVSFLSTNDINYTTGSLTESILIDWCKQIFSGINGSATRWMFTTPNLTAEIDKILIASGTLQSFRDESVLGVSATMIKSTFGKLMLFNHQELEELGKSNYGVVVDPANVRRRPLRSLRFKDVTGPKTDGTEVQWLEQCSLEVRNEATFAVVRDTATDSFA